MDTDLHWDMNELHEITNETHDGETNCDGLADLEELCFDVSDMNLSQKLREAYPFARVLYTGQETLRRGPLLHFECSNYAFWTHLITVLDELLWDFNDFFELFRHDW